MSPHSHRFSLGSYKTRPKNLIPKILSGLFVSFVIAFGAVALVKEVTKNSASAAGGAHEGFRDGNFYSCVVEMYNNQRNPEFYGEHTPEEALTDEELATISTLNCGPEENATFTDLTGIELLSNLSFVDLANTTGLVNTAIDFSGNPGLTHLALNDSNVTAIDITNNALLETLYIINTNLISVDLSGASSLINLSNDRDNPVVILYGTYATTDGTATSVDLSGAQFIASIEASVANTYSASEGSTDDVPISYDSDTGELTISAIAPSTVDIYGISVKSSVGAQDGNILSLQLDYPDDPIDPDPIDPDPIDPDPVDEKSDNAFLSYLDVGYYHNGEGRFVTLDPEFDKNVTEYDAYVTEEFDLDAFGENEPFMGSANPEDEAASVTGDIQNYLSRGLSVHTFTVVAEDGVTTKVYTVNIHYDPQGEDPDPDPDPESDNAFLSELGIEYHHNGEPKFAILDPEFDKNVTEYDAFISEDFDGDAFGENIAFRLDYALEDETAVVELDYQDNISSGVMKATATVVAEDGVTTKAYTVYIHYPVAPAIPDTGGKTPSAPNTGYRMISKNNNAGSSSSSIIFAIISVGAILAIIAFMKNFKITKRSHVKGEIELL